MNKNTKVGFNLYPLDDKIIDALFWNKNTQVNAMFGGLSKNAFFLNLYEFNLLVFYTQNKFGDLKNVDTEAFRHVANAKKKLYFSCVINKVDKYWYPEMIVYNNDPDKTFLIRKNVLKTFQPYFPDMSFDEQASKMSKLTIFHFNV